MTKKNIFCEIIILLGLILIFSCSQDPIFFTISTEPVPVPPRIQGSPTSMVLFERNSVPMMYVASGGLHWYTKNGILPGDTGWDSEEYGIPQPWNSPEYKDKPGKKIIGLAAAKNYLYALFIYGSDAATVLRRIGPDENEWKDVLPDNKIKYTLIQSIFADKDTGRLFAGAMNNNGSDYGILYLDENLQLETPVPTLELIIPDSEMLSGIASRDGIHYLSTRGNGVYRISETAFLANTQPTESDVFHLIDLEGNEKQNRLFMGMIKLNDGIIIAVERNGGTLFKVQEIGFRQMKYKDSDGKDSNDVIATGRYATGALALWQQAVLDENGVPINNDEVKKILVAGIQGGLYSTTTTSSYTHGYVEFELNPDGSLNLSSTNRNISPNVTVDGNTNLYTATIGKHPINHLYQTPPEIDPNMIFFASTQTAGLWSYRDRPGGLQWNAEK